MYPARIRLAIRTLRASSLQLCCEDWHNIPLADPVELAEKADQGFFNRNSSGDGNKNILKAVTLLMADPVEISVVPDN